MMEAGEFFGILLNSLYVSLAPTAAAAAVGTPLALWLYLRGGLAARAVEAALNGLTAMPTVLLGLLLYLLLARTGPLGPLEMLYTLNAVALGNALFVLPLYTAFALAVFRSLDPRIGELLAMYPVGRLRRLAIYVGEAAGGLLAAAVAAFGRALGELGIALMVGGDIRFRTRVLTTAVAHETMLGNWDAAIQLGLALLALAVAVSAAVNALGYRFRG